MAHLSDINRELITMYSTVRDCPEAVITQLKSMPVGPDAYYEIRENEPKDDISIAARFIYLNHYSFNGIYRVNANGRYNVPYGRRETAMDYNRIQIASDKLKSAEISAQEFSSIRGHVKQGDLVFLDPPYSSTVKQKESGFVAYTSHGFNIDDQKRLRELIDAIDDVGAFYVMTNGTAEIIAEIFDGCGQRATISRKCVISSMVNARDIFSEYVYTNIPGADISRGN